LELEKTLGERKIAPSVGHIAAAGQETHVEVRAQILASAKRMPAEALPLAALRPRIERRIRPHPLARRDLGSPSGSCRRHRLPWFDARDELRAFRDTLAERIGKRLAHGADGGALADAERVRTLSPNEAAGKLVDGLLRCSTKAICRAMRPALRIALDARLAAGGNKPLPVAALRAGTRPFLTAALKELSDKRTLARRRSEVAEALTLAGRTEAIDPLLSNSSSPTAPTARERCFSRYGQGFDRRQGTEDGHRETTERSIAADRRPARPFALRTLASRPRMGASARQKPSTLARSPPPPSGRISSHGRYPSPWRPRGKFRGGTALEAPSSPPDSRRKRTARSAALRAVARAGEGDATKGRAQFLARCADACHVLKGEGLSATSGRTVTGYDRSSLDFWVLNIVYPSLEIREGFGGRTMYDSRTAPSPTASSNDAKAAEIVLRDLAGRRTQVQGGQKSVPSSPARARRCRKACSQGCQSRSSGISSLTS
jgi:hypothetical protein